LKTANNKAIFIAVNTTGGHEVTVKDRKSHKLMINIDMDLYEYLRSASFSDRKSMSKIVNEAVRKVMNRKVKPSGKDPA
jgi:hypothetical protein